MLLRERMAAFIESITRQQYYKPESIQYYLLQVGVNTSVFVAVLLQVGVNIAVFHRWNSSQSTKFGWMLLLLNHARSVICDQVLLQSAYCLSHCHCYKLK